MLKKGVLVEVDHEEGEYISNIFLREKKESGKFRMILNLKKLNKEVEHELFKMDTLQVVLNLVFPGCWFLSLDFTDAYYSLAVHPDYRKYLRFEFEGKLLEFTCVPNGLRTGPRFFTKVLKVPLAYLREKEGVTISGYIDDSILLGDSPEEVMVAGQKAADLLQDLGYMISEEKSVVVPTQKIEYLGFNIDSRRMVVEMTELKVGKIRKLILEVWKQQRCTVRKIAQVLGKLNATRPANPWVDLYNKNLENLKIQELRNNGYDYDAWVTISPECMGDLQWWLENLEKLEKPIIRTKPDYFIHTDASMAGWGCHDNQTGETFGGEWSLEEKENHINYLELLGIFFGLKATCTWMVEKHIRIKSDNTTAVCCVQKQGSTQSRKCNRLAREIWNFAIERNLWISAEHCAGKNNQEADRGSRLFKDETEWAIRPEVFKDICKEFGNLDIDLFASRLNKKLDRFCSWHPDPEAEMIDAFLQDWTIGRVYVFPPFAVLSAVIQKFISDGAEGVIIAPYWPTKPWFTRLAETLIDIPILIPTNIKFVYLPSSTREHPMSQKLLLMVGNCSGKPSRPKAFRRRLSTQCRLPGENPRINFIPPTLTSGRHIVAKGVSIPCDQRYIRR